MFIFMNNYCGKKNELEICEKTNPIGNEIIEVIEIK